MVLVFQKKLGILGSCSDFSVTLIQPPDCLGKGAGGVERGTVPAKVPVRIVVVECYSSHSSWAWVT